MTSAFDSINLTTTFHRLARWAKPQDALWIRHDTRFQALVVEAQRRVSEEDTHVWPTDTLCILVWAAARLGVLTETRGLLEVIAERHADRGCKLTATGSELALLANGMARAGLHNKALFSNYAKHALDVVGIGALGMRDTSMLVWAMVTAKQWVGNEALFEAIADRIAQPGTYLSDFSPQALSIVSWGLATARAPGHERALRRIAKEVSERGARISGASTKIGVDGRSHSEASWAKRLRSGSMPAATKEVLSFAGGKIRERAAGRGGIMEGKSDGDLTVQEATKLLWACATADAGDNVFQGVMFAPQEASKLLWATARSYTHNQQLGKNAVGAPGLFEAFAADVIAQARAGSLSTVDLADLSWAYARTGRGTPELFDALSAAAQLLAPKFSPETAATLLRSLAITGHPATACFQQFATEVMRRVELFKGRAASNVLWAYVHSGNVNVELIMTLVSHCHTILEKLGPLDISEIFWALGVAKHSLEAHHKAIEAFLEAGTAYALPQLQNFASVDLANFAWGLHTHGLLTQRVASNCAFAAARILKGDQSTGDGGVGMGDGRGGRECDGEADGNIRVGVTETDPVKGKVCAEDAMPSWALAELVWLVHRSRSDTDPLSAAFLEAARNRLYERPNGHTSEELAKMQQAFKAVGLNVQHLANLRHGRRTITVTEGGSIRKNRGPANTLTAKSLKDN